MAKNHAPIVVDLRPGATPVRQKQYPVTREACLGIWDHWMDGDHCTVDGAEVLDGTVVIPSRLFDWQERSVPGRLTFI